MLQPRTTVFVSYCHRNRRWLERLRVHLTPLDKRGDLDLWDDSRIEPGARWHAEISRAIDRAAASIVLVSADFLASDFVAVHELPRLLQRAEVGGARVLPIFVEPCNLASHPELASFQALNSPARPLAKSTRADAERVLARAVEAVGRILAARLDALGPTPPAADVRGGDRTARHEAPPGSPDAAIFAELQSATITLSVLCTLAGDAHPSYSLSELEARLDVRSRKGVFEAVTALSSNGWVAKARAGGATRYRLTDEGARQLRRLAAAADGPLRRAAGPCEP